jgi:hypothetical protein
MRSRGLAAGEIIVGKRGEAAGLESSSAEGRFRDRLTQHYLDHSMSSMQAMLSGMAPKYGKKHRDVDNIALSTLYLIREAESQSGRDTRGK